MAALPEPKGDDLLEFRSAPERLTRDMASRPYRPTSLAGLAAGKWFDWMLGNDLKDFWRDERRKSLPPAVDCAQGTPEEVALRLIERDRGGSASERPPVVLAEGELPPSGHLRLELMFSSCYSVNRDEFLLRWDPAGSWLIVVSGWHVRSDSAFGLAQMVDPAEARRWATICLRLAQARFEALPAALSEKSESEVRYIFLSSQSATLTIRSDDRSVAEQVGHRLSPEKFDQPWRERWTPEFAAYLGRRVLGKHLDQLCQRELATRKPASSRAEMRGRLRDEVAAKARFILEAAERAPEIAMPLQLRQAVAAILEHQLTELHPLVQALAMRLPPPFPWEKRIVALETEIEALALELGRLSFPGLKEAIVTERIPMEGDVQPVFPSFVEHQLTQLWKKRKELAESKPTHPDLPYQIERDWADLRSGLATFQRSLSCGDRPAALEQWAREEKSGADWARRRLGQVAPATAAALVEDWLRDPRRDDSYWRRESLLAELRALAPARLPTVLAGLSPQLRKEFGPRFGSDDRAPRPVAERLEQPFRKARVGSGNMLVLDPLSAEEFASALREAEAGRMSAESRSARLLDLAPHAATQPEALRHRYLRLLPKLDRRERVHAIFVAELRSQRAFLLEHATSSPDDYAPGTDDAEPATQKFRLHQPRRILGLWDEPDVVTRAALAVAADLANRAINRGGDALRWRLQENFRSDVARLSAADRERVAVQLRELSEVLAEGSRPNDFEADWLAALESVSPAP